MNKLLRYAMLSLLAVLCGTSYAAQEASFDFTSVDNLKTYGVTNPPTKNGTEAAFVAFTNQGVSFSTVNGSTPTKYYRSSPKTGDGVITLRVYKDGKLTLSVDGKITSIEFAGNDLQNFAADNGTYSPSATTSASKATWTGSSASVTLTASKGVQIRTLTVKYAKAGEEPADQKVRLYKKATSVEAGKSYLIVGDKEGTLQMAELFTGNYGRLNAVNATVKGEYITTIDADNEFTFESVTGGYAIKQSNGKYLHASYDNKNNKYYNTFNFSEAPTSGNVFTVTANAGGTFTITNTLSNYDILYSATHSNFEGNKDKEGEVFPFLYEFYKEETYTPEITISGEQEFYGSTTVTISPSTAGNHIYYTLDGTEPEESDNPLSYTEPFTISESCTVKAYEEETELKAEMTFTKLEYSVLGIADFKKLEKKAVACLDLTNAKVLYSWKSNNNNVMVFVRDESGEALELYYSTKALDWIPETGKTLMGTIIMAYDEYNETPEAIVCKDTNADEIMAVDGEAAEPVECSIADVPSHICDLVLLKGLTPEKEAYTSGSGDNTFTAYNYYVKENEETFIPIFNNFHIAAYEDETDGADGKGNVIGGYLFDMDPSKKYDVKGISGRGTINKQKVSEIFIIEVTESEDTGIADIKAAKGLSDSRLFNLAGQQVSKNYKGVVIMNGKKLINK